MSDLKHYSCGDKCLLYITLFVVRCFTYNVLRANYIHCLDGLDLCYVLCQNSHVTLGHRLHFVLSKLCSYKRSSYWVIMGGGEEAKCGWQG